MNIVKNIVTPTGNIIIAETPNGTLEFLSLGDYGKEKNVKADFMGLTKEINGVPHGGLLPLSKKWVITISTQYGCSMNCKFCDVPKVGIGRNVRFNDLIAQVKTAISLHPTINYAERINLHYARMGEPLFNDDVISSAYYLAGMFAGKGWGFHPVISTIIPNTIDSKTCIKYITNWLRLKQFLGGNAGLQLSINTTSEKVRMDVMPNSQSPRNIAYIVDKALNKVKFLGRKITLNFAVTGAEINAKEIKHYFDPEYYVCKLTPMHQTKACLENNLVTNEGYVSYYPYKQIEEDLKKEGFDVIVFIPSKEEDDSRITCGNAILAEGRR